MERCYRHPQRETALSCARCERPICGQCAVHAPVGIRCPQCARPQRLPALEVSPLNYLAAGAVALGLGAAEGALYGLVLPFVVRVPLLPWVAILFLGYTIGEGISRVVNRKRGRGLQVLAGVGVVILYLVSNLMAFGALLVLDPFAIVLAVIAVAVAASRVH